MRYYNFLRDQKQSVSGFAENIKAPYELFVERLRSADPGLLEEGLRELDRLCMGSKGKWEALTKTNAADQEESGGFSFGFGEDEDGDVL